MKTEPNEPINPYSEDQKLDEDLEFTVSHQYNGLTKREYFAAIAMQGYLASYPSDSSPMPIHVAKLSVEYADGLIEALNSTGE